MLPAPRPAGQSGADPGVSGITARLWRQRGHERENRRLAHPGRTLIARLPARALRAARGRAVSDIAPEVSGRTGSMAEDEDQVKPSEQRGGTNVGDGEIREKGDWVDAASDGVVPPELGGS